MPATIEDQVKPHFRFWREWRADRNNAQKEVDMVQCRYCPWKRSNCKVERMACHIGKVKGHGADICSESNAKIPEGVVNQIRSCL